MARAALLGLVLLTPLVVGIDGVGTGAIDRCRFLAAGDCSAPAPPPGMARITLADGRLLDVARVEVTSADWQACHAAGACTQMPRELSAVQGGGLPVVEINWFDVEEYLTWIGDRTGRDYRLPTLAEWRQIAVSVVREDPRRLFTDPRLAWAANYGSERPMSAVLRPAGGFSTTANGIADLDGNVWEWTSTCAAEGFDGELDARCPAYFLGGEHIAAMSVFVRDPASGGCIAGTPPSNLGLRLVAEPGIPTEPGLRRVARRVWRWLIS